jgi:predicted kinase
VVGAAAGQRLAAPLYRRGVGTFGAVRSCVVVISGLPGTGKSTLAIALAERIQAVAVSRDAARQALGGPARLSPIATRLGRRHRRGLQEKATRRLEAMVAEALDRDRAVVVELVADGDARRRFDELAAKHAVPVYSIEVFCSDAAELARRLRARPGSWQQVVAQMSMSYQPAPGALVVDSRHPVEQLIERAVEFMSHGTR